VKFFHSALKETCDRFDPDFYGRFKSNADDYFFIRHRNETRGIGGIFFDHLSKNEKHSHDRLFDFTLAVGKTFIPVYLPLVEKNESRPYGAKEIAWMKLRRGRYVEFNLIYDRGTRFGLETNGRTESILMSLPPEAGWTYDHIPEKGSAEEFTLSRLVKGINWTDESENLW
jgi:coproporphyrinogen III oxidase